MSISLVKLRDLAFVDMGLSPSGKTYNNDSMGLPLLNGPTEFGEFNPNCTLFTTDSKRQCKKGDLIFCVRGSTTGRMNWADKLYSLGRGVCSIRGKNELLTYYVRCCLENNLEGLLQLAGGGTFPNLRRGDIENFDVPFSQNAEVIAKTLKAYDDLIENNLKRIKLLEEAAQLLYKKWFVDFKFPNHEKTKFINGIPKGWEKKKIGDIVVLNYGKALKASNRIEGEFPVYGSSGIVGTHEKALVKGPGVIVGRKGNVGSVFWSSDNFHPIDTVYYLTSDLSLEYIFLVFKNISFISSDVAIPGLNRNYAYSLPMLVPSEKSISQFEQHIKPLFKSIDNLNLQNQKLKEARDLLLPRLMDGCIEV